MNVCSAEFLAEVARRAVMSDCHTNTSGVRRTSTLETKFQISSSLKPLDLQFSNFTWSMIQLQGFRVNLGKIEFERWSPLLKTVNNNFSRNKPIFGMEYQ